MIPIEELDTIGATIQRYIDGAKSGRSDDMKPAFYPGASIFGFVGDELMAGPIQQLFDWNDKNGPADGLRARLASIDAAGTVASVRVEIENWTGHRFTDFFILLKNGERWQIVGKAFHLHS